MHFLSLAIPVGVYLAAIWTKILKLRTESFAIAFYSTGGVLALEVLVSLRMPTGEQEGVWMFLLKVLMVIWIIVSQVIPFSLLYFFLVWGSCWAIDFVRRQLAKK